MILHKKSVNRHFVSCVILIVLITCWGCDYGRMYDQDVIKTFRRGMPAMDKRTIPLNDGYQALAGIDPEQLRNPLAYSPENTERGRIAYGYFCMQCHGKRLEGRGTVGQSFSPLPSDLTSRAVLSQSDGLIYSKIMLGFKRHPALFPITPADDGWAVIVYMRSAKGDT